MTPPSKKSVARAALSLLLTAICSPRHASANMAQPVFIHAARSRGVLTTAVPDRVRVDRIDLDLDFREHGRGPSTARYELTSAEDMDIPLDFVAPARVVSVVVDGAPVAFQKTTVGERYRLKTPAGQELTFGRDETAEHEFRASLRAGQKAIVAITFEVEPGASVERLAKDMDGLTRLFYRDEYHPRSLELDYPLWPAVGFGGGVGPMSVRLRTSRGARIAAPGVALPSSAGEGELRVEIPAAAPGVGLDREVTVRGIRVSYPVAVWKMAHLGASLFPNVRVSSGDEGSGRFQLRGSVDVYAPDAGALTLAAEADFRGTLAAILSLQRGGANAYGSAYWALGAVAFARPGTAVGVEGAVGFRALVLPFDFALQAIPLRSAQAAGVGQVRALFGVRVGF